MSDAEHAQLYTLHEAKLKLARDECRRVGHEIEIIVDGMTGSPIRLNCSRCPRWWACTSSPTNPPLDTARAERPGGAR